MSIEDEFIFIPHYDQFGNDLEFVKGYNIKELMEYCLNSKGAVGFNTIGFLKKDITNLSMSYNLFLNENEGIYILKKAFFTFLPNYEQEGSDLFKMNGTIDELMLYSIFENNCVAFSTSGFIKNKVDKLQYNHNLIGGIYIKTKHIKTNEPERKFLKDEFLFIPQKDQIHFDIDKNDNLHLLDKMEKSINDKKIVAFNTRGFYKSNIINLTESKYYNKSDGIYIKMDYLTQHILKKIFHYDEKIINNIFIESGSFQGDGIQAAIDIGFKEIHSIELSNKYYNICKERFKNNPNVHLHLGDSGIYLEEVLKNINTGVTFWLDGHYSCLDTACSDEYLSPIKNELEIIKKYNNPNHVILVDDMISFTDYSIEHDKTVHKKCGYMTKPELEIILKEIQGEDNIQYYFIDKSCISYQKSK